MERSHFVRDLHDGALQSMIGVAIQLDVVSRHSSSQTVTVPPELARIHNPLLEEARKAARVDAADQTAGRRGQ